VSRRAQRLAACQTWLDRYLGQQDPFNLDRQTVVLVDALVNGVFGASVRMQCSSRIEQWVTELEAQAGLSKNSVPNGKMQLKQNIQIRIFLKLS
jgi:hypothetical protein